MDCGNASSWRDTVRHLPFDNTTVLRRFADLRYLEQVGLIGEFVLDEFRDCRPRVVPFTYDTLAQFRQIDPEDYVPNVYRI